MSNSFILIHSHGMLNRCNSEHVTFSNVALHVCSVGPTFRHKSQVGLCLSVEMFEFLLGLTSPRALDQNVMKPGHFS